MDRRNDDYPIPRPLDSDWPETLKTSYSICANCGFPSVIYWGEELSLYYNQEYAHILGDKHPDAFGKPVAEVYPEVWETLSLQLESVRVNREILKFSDTLFLLERHGYLEECYFDYTLSPLFDINGAVVGVFNFAIETTLRKLSQRRTDLISKFISQQHYAQSVTSCVDGCRLILEEALEDIPFHLLYIKSNNDNYKLVSSSGIKQPHQDINWPIDEVLRSGTYKHIENLSDFFADPIVNLHSEPCVEAVIVPLKHEYSSLSSYLVAGLSPRKRFCNIYLEFIQSVSWHMGACLSSATSFDQFVELEEEKDNLLAVISHELKTPMTSIIAYAQIVKRNLTNRGESLSDALLEHMEDQITKLSTIINDMVDGSNLRTGKIIYRKQEFSFDRMVKSTVSAFEKNNKQSILLDLNIDKEFLGDEQRLKQVVDNLISNALKYSAAESEIKIRTKIIDDQLNFCIQDNGIGIKPEDRDKIFEPFYRGVSVKQYTTPGIGLGLFIANEIIKFFGGKIWVDSQPGSQAKFSFTLPLS